MAEKHPLDPRFLEEAYRWLRQSENRISSKKTKVGVVRGFFVANWCQLPKNKHRFHSNKAPVMDELTVEEFQAILRRSNFVYRAAFLMMFQSGSGVGELLYMNTVLAHEIWNEVRRGANIIRLNLPGRKANRNVQPYYSFIGSDAVDTLRLLFHSRGWREDSVLFRSKHGKPLTVNCLQNYFRAQAVTLGFIEPKTFPCLRCGGETVRHRGVLDGEYIVYYLCLQCQTKNKTSDYHLTPKQVAGIRYRMRTHELRDLFRTEWHRAQTVFGVDGDAGEFFMGHTVDPLKYDKIMRDKSFWLEQYRRAMPMLNILSEDPRKIKRSEVHAQLEASEAKADALAVRVVELERIVQVLDDPVLIEKLRQLTKE